MCLDQGGKGISVPCRTFLMQECDVSRPGGKAGVDPWRRTQ